MLDSIYINKAIKKAKSLGYTIVPSNAKNKKFMIIVNNKKIHFGDSRYSDYLIHNDQKRRENFHIRFRNNVNYNDPLSALYYSQKILW